jgi:hypothetical protein
MAWSLGWDERWHRWVGYGVPAYCDHAGCEQGIDRGLAHVCGGESYGGEHGCGLHFCGEHLYGATQACLRCYEGQEPFTPKPEHPSWVRHLLQDPSWAAWRAEHPVTAARLRVALEAAGG